MRRILRLYYSFGTLQRAGIIIQQTARDLVTGITKGNKEQVRSVDILNCECRSEEEVKPAEISIRDCSGILP